MNRNEADIDRRDGEGWTALMFAARYGYQRVVHRLMKAGANIEARNKDRYCAFIYAAWFGHWETLKLLGDAQADPNMQNKFGETARYFAESFASDKIVQLVQKYELLAEIRRLNKIVAERDATIERLKREYNELEARFKARMEADARRIAGLKATIKALRKVNDQLKKTIVDLKKAHAAEKARLEAQIRNLDETLESEIDRCEKKRHKLELEVIELNREIHSNHAEIDMHRHVNKKLIKASDGQLREIEELKIEISDIMQLHRSELKQHRTMVAAREAAVAAMRKIAKKVVDHTY